MRFSNLRPNFNRLSKLTLAASATLLGFSLSPGGSCPGLLPAVQAADKAASADEAWKEVEKAVRPPNFPPEWQKQRPSREEYAKVVVPHALAAAAKAKEFFTQHASHPKAGEAKRFHEGMLETAANLGSDEATQLIAKLETEKLNDKSMPEDERFQIRTKSIQRAAMAKQSGGMTAVFAEFEAGIRKLMVEFPKRGEPYAMLLEVAANAEADRASVLIKEILASPAEDEVKDQAKALAKKYETLGKPLPMNFKAVDGRDVNVANMKGKVVLVDFWATWCGPCVAELPNVLEAYRKLNPKGFEIVGISFDNNKKDLVDFVAEQKMPWVQYFDGKGWKNDFGVAYGINSIPAMWLVDKKGLVRDLNAREGLADKVEKLLAEP